MGIKTLVISVLLSSILFSPFNAEDQPLICSKCTCTSLNGTFLQANCSSDIRSILQDVANSTNSAKPLDGLIQSLIIRNNELVNLTEEFRYVNLVQLDLSKNQIAHIANKVFSKLQELKTLILSHNNIEVLQPNAFQGEFKEGAFMPLSSLRTILLDNNNLHSLNADLFEHTEQIESLSLAYNPLSIIDTHTAIAITNLIHLKFLDLSYTQLSALPQSFLHTPKYLMIFNLSGNYFTEVPKELGEAHSLETFIFNDNPLVNLTRDNGFPKIPTLRTLHMCQMPKLTTIGTGSLGNLINLEEIFVAGNPELTRIDSDALASSSQIGAYKSRPVIKKLYLNDNQISYLNESLLTKWDTLVELDLLNNPWTCECENQWMVEGLMHIYLRIDEEKAKLLKCAAPIEMISFTFEQLYRKNSHMRCLDLYGARPEKDTAILVGMLAGIMIGIPIVLFCLYSYRRHWFGIFDDSPAAFSRQFYSKTSDVYEY